MPFRFRRLTTMLAVLFLVSTIILSSCNMPIPNQPLNATQPDTSSIIMTAAAQTVIAQLTKNAASSATPVPAGETPAAASATPAPVITDTPSASPTPSLTATATLSPTLTVAPTSTSVPTDPKLSLGEPTFQDTFKNDKNWALFDDEHTSMEVSNGNLVMVAKKAESWDSWLLTWPKATNFYIEMTASPGACSGRDRYGLMLRASADANKGYLFAFTCDGEYSFRKWDGKKYTLIVDWTSSQFIKIGEGQINRLGVQANGDSFNLYANGSKLTEFTDASFDSGQFGVFVGSQNTEDFTVKVSEVDYWKLP